MKNKDRKALETYVSLRGYKNGGVGKNHVQDSQNEKVEKMILYEIARQLGMSKVSLARILAIERNLTEAMKEFT